MKNKLLIIFVFISSFCISQQRYSVDFSLEDVAGNRVIIGDFLKKGPVYINFWSLTCIPCRSELKAIQQIYESLKDSSCTIISINIDNTKSIAKVKSFVNSQKFKTLILLDPDSHIFEKFNGKFLPYSILLNSYGEIIKVRTGYLPGDEKEIKQDIIDILKVNKHEN